MMKVITSILGFCASVYAIQAQNSTNPLQAMQQMPACGIACMAMYIPQSPCAVTDQHCLCTNVALGADITSCVKANCTYRDALTTTNSVSLLCDWPIRDRRPVIRAVTIPFFVAATLFYLARMMARMPFFGGEFGLDDYAISIAYLFTVGCTTVQLLLTTYGVGLDVYTVPHSHADDKLTTALKITVAYEQCYLLATWFTKISILLLYLRIFQDAKLRVWIKYSLAFCAATLFCLFWPNIFHCWPVSYAWTFWDGEHKGSCTSTSGPFWASASLNIFGDLLMICLPLPTIWKMSLSKKKRIGIMIMFSAGIIITIVSSARLSTLHVFDHSQNQTYDYVDAILYTIVEVDITLICACLPGTRNFYDRVICGRIIGKGQFAKGASRSESMMAQQQSTTRSNSARSKMSDASTLRASTPSHGVIYIIKDIDIEQQADSPESHVRSWSDASSVEEWPVRIKE